MEQETFSGETLDFDDLNTAEKYKIGRFFFREMDGKINLDDMLLGLRGNKIYQIHSQTDKTNDFVGAMSFLTRSKGVYVSFMAIEPKYKNKGFGRFFMKALFSLQKRGYSVRLHHDESLRKFYEKLGFKSSQTNNKYTTGERVLRSVKQITPKHRP